VRLVLGVVLVLGSVLIGAKIVSSASRTYPTVAAKRDLAVGSIVTADDVKLAQVQLPKHGNGVYLARIDEVVGKRLARAISSGELVPADAVAALPAQTTVTVPLESGAAPDLRKGQRIELWVSAATCDSVVLLPDVTVQAVHADTGGSFSTGDGGQVVVISVSAAMADRVIKALALEDAKLRAGVLVGTSEAGRAGPALVDLSSCSSPAAGR
jgi:SAF domain